MRLTLTACIALAVFGTNLWSQNARSGALTIGGGLALGVNEATGNNATITGQFRAAFLYAFSKGVAVELGGGYARFASSSDTVKFGDYTTNAIPIDVRVKLSPFQSGGVKPYLFAGLGYAMYSYTGQTLTSRHGGNTWRSVLESEQRQGGNAIATEKISDSTGTGAFYVPLGIGTYIKLSSRVGLDLSVGT
ncbi:MAG: outer membrane beta-barrel protein, partial [Candidatus Kapabacteria bacterium]|nr:outer membrane beta-barrel protein [Candidatus Kapabacteria bacterium]